MREKRYGSSISTSLSNNLNINYIENELLKYMNDLKKSESRQKKYGIYQEILYLKGDQLKIYLGIMKRGYKKIDRCLMIDNINESNRYLVRKITQEINRMKSLNQ